MTVLVCGIIEKDDKYLLVQEAKAKCYGKWNLPAGHLEAGESIFDAIAREVKEETNCDAEPTAICNMANFIYDSGSSITITFKMRLLSANLQPKAGEILDVKWFSYDEIIAMKDQLRTPELTIPDLDACRTGVDLPLSTIRTVKIEPK